MLEGRRGVGVSQSCATWFSAINILFVIRVEASKDDWREEETGKESIRLIDVLGSAIVVLVCCEGSNTSSEVRAISMRTNRMISPFM
jgi:hypothetical protein